jgi:hypothetical protein
MFVSTATKRLKTATLPLFADRIEDSPGVVMLHLASSHWVPLRWVRSRESVTLASTDELEGFAGKRTPQRVEEEKASRLTEIL